MFSFVKIVVKSEHSSLHLVPYAKKNIYYFQDLQVLKSLDFLIEKILTNSFVQYS